MTTETHEELDQVAQEDGAPRAPAPPGYVLALSAGVALLVVAVLLTLALILLPGWFGVASAMGPA